MALLRKAGRSFSGSDSVPLAVFQEEHFANRKGSWPESLSPKSKIFFFSAASTLQMPFPYLVTGVLAEKGQLIWSPACAAPQLVREL